MLRRQKSILRPISKMESGSLDSNDQKFRFRRVAYPLRVAVVTVIVLSLLAAAFLAGRFIERPTRDAIQSAQQAIDVWSAVETKAVDDRVTFTGRVQPGTDVSVVVTSDTGPNVVVRQTLAVGARVEAGTLAGVVSGRPYFFLPGPLPLYRDVSLKDEGDDVLALQTALASLGYLVELSSVVDHLTMNAVKHLFTTAGFALPELPAAPQGSAADGPDARTGGAAAKAGQAASTAKSPYIPFRQLLLMPAGGGVVATSALVGAELNADTPLLTVRATPSYVEFIAEVAQADLLQTGQKLTVRLDSKEFLATVATIGAFQAAKEGIKPGKAISLAPAEGGDLALPVGQAATIVTVGHVEASLSVPLIAVREDASGHYVIRRGSAETTDSGSSSPAPATLEERIDVKVLRTGGGFAAISADLHPGDQVKVS
ncbi:hypothetical protein ACQCSU_21620 (plasmid) [Pseudarthrobacter sp. O4]|uniref:hypothetical protein n=1 Tax=Pseudarthrobacter sp. O4 TaxID=3418417 RepID=UPI003CE6D6E2